MISDPGENCDGRKCHGRADTENFGARPRQIPPAPTIRSYRNPSSGARERKRRERRTENPQIVGKISVTSGWSEGGALRGSLRDAPLHRRTIDFSRQNVSPGRFPELPLRNSSDDDDEDRRSSRSRGRRRRSVDGEAEGETESFIDI